MRQQYTQNNQKYTTTGGEHTMTLRVKYTIKQRVWDAFSCAPSNREELVTLLKTESGRGVVGWSRGAHFKLSFAGDSTRSAELYVSFVGRATKWFVAYYKREGQAIYLIHTTPQRRFYGRHHLHAIIAAINQYSTVVYAE